MDKSIKNVWWAWAIKNMTCMICWTILAIVFDKWGIALFGLFTMSNLTSQPGKYYYRICDKCGRHSEYADTFDVAIEAAKKNGWLYDKDKNKDYCPDCQ